MLLIHLRVAIFYSILDSLFSIQYHYKMKLVYTSEPIPAGCHSGTHTLFFVSNAFWNARNADAAIKARRMLFHPPAIGVISNER